MPNSSHLPGGKKLSDELSKVSAESVRSNEDLDSVSAPKQARLLNDATSSENTILEQHIPPLTFKFPRDKDGRCCQHDWFVKYPWMHYVEEKDIILCFTCLQAHKYGKTSTSRRNEDAFISVGFRKWKKGIEKLNVHRASQHHLDSLNRMHELQKDRPINNIFETSLRKEQQDARASLRIIISSIRYLARSGQALRGHDNECGNLMQLLEERCMGSPELKQWVTRRDKWLSGDVQNEIIEIMSHKVMRMIIENIKKSFFFSIMADGTTDITGNEQFSICVRIVDSVNFEIKELFLGLYNPPDSKAETLHKTLNDVLIRLNLKKKTLEVIVLMGLPRCQVI